MTEDLSLYALAPYDRQGADAQVIDFDLRLLHSTDPDIDKNARIAARQTELNTSLSGGLNNIQKITGLTYNYNTSGDVETRTSSTEREGAGLTYTYTVALNGVSKTGGEVSDEWKNVCELQARICEANGDTDMAAVYRSYNIFAITDALGALDPRKVDEVRADNSDFSRTLHADWHTRAALRIAQNMQEKYDAFKQNDPTRRLEKALDSVGMATPRVVQTDDQGQTRLVKTTVDAHGRDAALAAGANPNALHSATGDPLIFHAQDVESARALIEKGANLNVTAGNGFTPMHFAKSADMVALYRQHGLSVTAVNQDQQTPLHMVSIHGDKATAEAMIAAGADVKAVDAAGNTPLMIALLRRDADRDLTAYLAAQNYDGLDEGVKARQDEQLAAWLQNDENKAAYDAACAARAEQDAARTVSTEPVRRIVRDNVSKDMHIYSPADYRRVHRQVSRGIYDRNTDQTMLRGLRALEDNYSLPAGRIPVSVSDTKGSPITTSRRNSSSPAGQLHSNSEMYLYKLRRFNQLISNDDRITINGETQTVQNLFRGPDGNGLTPREAEALLKSGRKLNEEESRRVCTTLETVTRCVNPRGKIVVPIRGHRGDPYKGKGNPGFTISTQTQSRVVSDTIVGVRGTPAERQAQIDAMSGNGVFIKRNSELFENEKPMETGDITEMVGTHAGHDIHGNPLPQQPAPVPTPDAAHSDGAEDAGNNAGAATGTRTIHRYSTTDYNNAQAKVRGGLFKGRGRRRQEIVDPEMIGKIQDLEANFGLPSGPTNADGQTTSNANMYLFKLHQMCEWVGNDSDITVDGKTMSVSRYFRGADGNGLTPKEARDMLRSGKPLGDKDAARVAATLQKVERFVNPQGQIIVPVVGARGRFYLPRGGKSGFTQEQPPAAPTVVATPQEQPAAVVEPAAVTPEPDFMDPTPVDEAAVAHAPNNGTLRRSSRPLGADPIPGQGNINEGYC